MCQQAVERKGLDKQDLSRTGRMALYGGGRRLPTPSHAPISPPPVRYHISIPRSSAYQSYLSRFWAWCNPVVQVPTKAHCPEVRKHNHCRPGPSRSIRLRFNQSLPLLKQYGIHGGYRSKGEVE